VTTPTNGVKDTDAELASVLKPGAGAPISNRPIEADRYAEERQSEAHQDAIQIVERTELVRSTARRTTDVEQISAAPRAGAWSYAAFEADFRDHHHTNAARRSGPYEHYRLVYRYGYDLGVDTRYRGAAWSTVEQEARPRWEERNPGTWEQFKDTIRYAWDTTRSQC
jgi:hypothetical protein